MTYEALCVSGPLAGELWAKQTNSFEVAVPSAEDYFNGSPETDVIEVSKVRYKFFEFYGSKFWFPDDQDIGLLFAELSEAYWRYHDLSN